MGQEFKKQQLGIVAEEGCCGIDGDDVPHGEEPNNIEG
jgi:hypothetical protein